MSEVADMADLIAKDTEASESSRCRDIIDRALLRDHAIESIPDGVCAAIVQELNRWDMSKELKSEDNIRLVLATFRKLVR